MRILVTGASGFIGLPIVMSLEKQGDKVLALSRTKPAPLNGCKKVPSLLAISTTYGFALSLWLSALWKK